jgi:integrase
MARNLTDKGVAALKPKKSIYTFRDPQMPGHFVRVRPTGSKQFVAMARDISGTQVWETLGAFPLLTIEEAREKAKDTLKRIKTGQDRSGPKSFAKVVDEWLRRHIEERGVITERAIRGRLHQHVLPVWGVRDFTSIKRGDVTALMDSIVDSSGPVAADKVLGILSSLFNWYTTRNGDYVSPIVRGMRRTSISERARDRTLSDDEIRIIWNTAPGAFGDLIRMLLLTGQRREKVTSMRWEDVSVDGVWSVKNGMKREKGAGGDLALPPMALDIIRARPRVGDNPFCVRRKGEQPFQFSQRQQAQARQDDRHYRLDLA